MSDDRKQPSVDPEDPIDLLLPEATRLLHIGPHKTGTTTVQSAFRRSRALLPDFGVRYPGHRGQHIQAALAVSGRGSLSDKSTPVDLSYWTRLVDEVRAAGTDRVVISSEFFSEIDDATARRVLAELGGGHPMHVVVTLRPLGRIMPSAWQQFVRNGMRTPYERWLRSQLDEPAGRPVQSIFWTRHRHGELVSRWAELAGPDNVTVVVLDETDHLHVLRVFEQLVGLRPGLLVPDPSRTNRSLTLGEVELVRHLNHALHGAKLSHAVYRKLVTESLVSAMQNRTPDRSEARIATPAWALDRAHEHDADTVRLIDELGVRVLGPIEALTAPPRPSSAGTGPAQIGSEAAAQLVFAALEAAAPGIRELDPTDESAGSAQRRPTVSSLRSTQLLGVVATRLRRRLATGVRSVASRSPRG